MLFADDVLLFCRANVEGARALYVCVAHSCKCSSQVINFNKSGILISKNTYKSYKRTIKSVMRLKGIKANVFYLKNPFSAINLNRLPFLRRDREEVD